MTEDDSADKSPPRLGDDIDDYCSRCRGLSTHAVAAILDGQVLKVLCRACLSEHKFRHGKGGKSKDLERKKLLEEVLKGAPFHKPE